MKGLPSNWRKERDAQDEERTWNFAVALLGTAFFGYVAFQLIRYAIFFA